MISQISHIKLLLEDIQEYIKTNIELEKLKAVDKSSDIVSSIFASIAILIIGTIFIVILSIALCLLIGHIMGDLTLGFFVMAGVWGIICGLFYISRKKWLKKPAQDTVVKKILE